jgi:hypothetical protein
MRWKQAFLKTRARAGFTLVEALSTLCVFGTFLVILFLTIAWGFRAFSLAVAKSDVTTEARRMALFVERELRSSTYFSVTMVTRSLGTDRRDAICFVSRNDWSSPSAYDRFNGIPAWNRYFAYYATLRAPFGEFVRMSINPVLASEIGSFPYAPFADPVSQINYLRDDPTSTSQPDIESSRSIASSVQSFEVKKIPTTQEIEMRLLLRQNGIMARRANTVREGGTFELQYRVQPQNTL